jgi:hypothetical protein
MRVDNNSDGLAPPIGMYGLTQEPARGGRDRLRHA